MHCTIQGMCERNKINVTIILMPVLATNLLIMRNYNDNNKMCTQHNYYTCLFTKLAMVLTIQLCYHLYMYSDFSCILDLMKYKQCVYVCKCGNVKFQLSLMNML